MATLPSAHVAVLLLVALLSQADCHQASSSETRKVLRESTSLETGERTVRKLAQYKSKCPAGCTEKGVCNEDLGRCDCPRHLIGPACNQIHPDLSEICNKYGFDDKRACTGSAQMTGKEKLPCFNSCNGRGKCVAGICHCEPGFWGRDCSLSRGEDGSTVLLAGQGYKPRKLGVKIYVYDLPGNMTFWYNFNHLDRPLPLLFWQRLMSAGVLTTNGDEADYFYIPFNSRVTDHPDKLHWAVSYIRETWPYWDRKGGHDHLVMHLGDTGINDIPQRWRRELNETITNITWLTHWGVRSYNKWGKWFPNFRAGKDIVIPVAFPPMEFYQSPLNPRIQKEWRDTGRPITRNGSLFFAGRICGDRAPPNQKTHKCTDIRKDYSAYVRQRVYEEHWDKPGFKLVPWTESYIYDFSSHKYCLAPTGGGYCKRQALSVLMGCVPVTIADGVYQPFEPDIDWSQFSVPVAEDDIPRLPQILNSISNEKYASMQSKMSCASQHMFYSSTLGGIFGEDGRYDAIETILEILRMHKEHPDVPPEQYVKVDERFRKFINCGLGDADPKILCTHGPARNHPDMPTCGECRLDSNKRISKEFYAWPGGAICCNEAQIGKCPRQWE